jgi:glycine dehydrogenase
MLKTCKTESLESLIKETVPSNIVLKKESIEDQKKTLGEPISELTALQYLKDIASKNIVNKNYIGGGYNPVIVPPVVLRNVLENPAWYTSYTPYQAEISQGRLESLLNYQTMITEITGLPFSNASLLDEATAAAEAMYLAYNVSNGKKKTFKISENLFPFIKDTIRSRAHYLGINVEEGVDNISEDVFGVIVQNPDNNGKVHDYTEFTKKMKEKGIVTIVAADILSMMITKSPGEMGFDIAVGSAQRFGVPMMNGGPHAGFFAVIDEYKRKVPGRVVGVSKDSHGNPALRLALQTREQHIRRDKATSNICTAQALLANMSAFFAIFHGKDGLINIAKRVNLYAIALASQLKTDGYKLINNVDEIFDTVSINIKESGINFESLKIFEEKGINIRFVNDNIISVTINETTNLSDLEDLINIFVSLKKKSYNIENIKFTTELKNQLRRGNNDFLKQDIFNKYSSETEVLRYIYKLQLKDISLCNSMISLGSCTMKMNATSELIPVTWPEFTEIHPFSNKSQMKGYQQMIDELTDMLRSITTFDAVSLQPNSGANGEYAGLLAIRRYHDSLNQGHRNICLIPSSAHGTNPASAAIAGLKVIVVACDSQGNINVDDLKQKAEQYKDNLSALMVTYPSTHGVFEESIIEICDTIHKYGGQVYMDGANMNAQVLITSPSTIGADVCHLNLHKTFCIPHGGGGPGVGPICVRKHLAPYVPGHFEFNSNIYLTQKAVI